MPYATWTNPKTGITYRYFSKPNHGREGHKILGKRLGEVVDQIAKDIETKYEVPADRVQIRVKGIRIIRPQTLAKMKQRGRELMAQYGPNGQNVLHRFQRGQISTSQIRNAALARRRKAMKRMEAWKGREAALRYGTKSIRRGVGAVTGDSWFRRRKQPENIYDLGPGISAPLMTQAEMTAAYPKIYSPSPYPTKWQKFTGGTRKAPALVEEKYSDIMPYVEYPALPEEISNRRERVTSNYNTRSRRNKPYNLM